MGNRLAARIAGEIGDHLEQFDSPRSLQCYAATAPVTRRSGMRDIVIAHRTACNHFLANAVDPWAFASLRRSAWGKAFYDAQRSRQGAPRRAPGAGEPLARGPLALPAPASYDEQAHQRHIHHAAA